MNKQPITCNKEELIKKLQQFPADQKFTHFENKPDTCFVQWCNGHCFMWEKINGAWECDEI